MEKKDYKSIYILLGSNIILLSSILIFLRLSKSIGLYLFIPLAIINRNYVKDAKKVYKNIDGIIVWVYIAFIICMSIQYLNMTKGY